MKCDVKIAYVNNIKRHILKCKGPKQEVYSCTSCKRDFKYPSKLEEHLIAHNKNYYSCEKCGKSYQREHFYRQHLVTCAEFALSFITSGKEKLIINADVPEPEVQNENGDEYGNFNVNNPAQKATPLETTQTIYDEWLSNTIPSVVSGSETVKLHKSNYLKQYSGIVNNLPLTETTNKRKITFYEATRGIITCTVKEL